VHRHENAGDQGNKNAVQDVKSQQGVRPDFAAAEEKRARVVDRIGADEIRIDSGIVSRTHRSIPFDRIQDVGRQVISPAKDDQPAKKETGIPVVFMYGEHDWSDAAGGLAAEEKLKQAKIKALLHGTDEEKRGENGSAKVVMIPKAGHHLYLDNPDFFNNIMKEEMESTLSEVRKRKLVES
jgi:pimeloyl-ACP methyl ester carboxylesterase